MQYPGYAAHPDRRGSHDPLSDRDLRYNNPSAHPATDRSDEEPDRIRHEPLDAPADWNKLPNPFPPANNNNPQQYVFPDPTDRQLYTASPAAYSHGTSEPYEKDSFAYRDILTQGRYLGGRTGSWRTDFSEDPTRASAAQSHPRAPHIPSDAGETGQGSAAYLESAEGERVPPRTAPSILVRGGEPWTASAPVPALWAENQAVPPMATRHSSQPHIWHPVPAEQTQGGWPEDGPGYDSPHSTDGERQLPRDMGRRSSCNDSGHSSYSPYGVPAHHPGESAVAGPAGSPHYFGGWAGSVASTPESGRQTVGYSYPPPIPHPPMGMNHQLVTPLSAYRAMPGTNPQHHPGDSHVYATHHGGPVRTSGHSQWSGNSGGYDPGSSGRKKKRETQEVEAVCGRCHSPIAKLMLRGTWEEMRVEGGFDTVHTCRRCREADGITPIGAVAQPSNCSSDSDEPVGGDLGPARLRQKAAAAKGEIITPPAPPFGDPNVVPAPLRIKSTVATFRKRNRRTDDVNAPTICDCCLRELGAGGIVPRNGRSTIKFAVEIVCHHCLSRYRRCTDCGGGGGARLGVGKWRAKELFAEGRRTCTLSHQRQGLPTEIKYIIWRIRDIPEDERPTIVGQVRQLLRQSLLSGLAIPEIMETGLAHISEFQDIENILSNGWQNALPLFTEDVEPTKNRRRYLGLRWSKPHPRKGPRPAEPSDTELDSNGRRPSESALRPGMDLSGFVTAEWDMDTGSVFVSLIVPWQMGDSFEATGSLTGYVLRQVFLDRQSIIQSLVQRGQSLASVEAMWTMMFLAREARPVNYLEKRRDFAPLDEYLEANPEVSPRLFAPIRDCYVPVANQRGWQILVRRQHEKTLEEWDQRITDAQRLAIAKHTTKRTKRTVEPPTESVDGLHVTI